MSYQFLTSKQGEFMQVLSEFLTSNFNIARLIIGGDWNATLESIDKKGGLPWRPMSYRNQIFSLMVELDLVD